MVSWLGSPLCHRASAEATTDKELTNRPIMKTYDKIKTSYIHAIPNKERKMLMWNILHISWLFLLYHFLLYRFKTYTLWLLHYSFHVSTYYCHSYVMHFCFSIHINITWFRTALNVHVHCMYRFRASHCLMKNIWYRSQLQTSASEWLRHLSRLCCHLAHRRNWHCGLHHQS